MEHTLEVVLGAVKFQLLCKWELAQQHVQTYVKVIITYESTYKPAVILRNIHLQLVLLL